MRFPCRTLPAAPINMIRPYKEIYEPISRFRVPTDRSFPTDPPIRFVPGQNEEKKVEKTAGRRTGPEDRALTFINSRVNRLESANFVTMLPFIYSKCKLIPRYSSSMQRVWNDTWRFQVSVIPKFHREIKNSKFQRSQDFKTYSKWRETVSVYPNLLRSK